MSIELDGRLSLAVINSQGYHSIAENSEVSLGWETLRCQTLQVAIRDSCSRPTMLQTKVLRNKEPSMHPDDPHGSLLHHALSLLLARSKRRPSTEMGRNPAAQTGRSGRNR